MPYIDKNGHEFEDLVLAVDSHCLQQKAKSSHGIGCKDCVLRKGAWLRCCYLGQNPKDDQIVIEALGLTLKES